MLKRATAAGLAVAMVAVAATIARADDKGERAQQTVIVSRSFTMPKGHCSQLPADAEVQGLGLERTTTVATQADGRLAYARLSTITGTATDNFGGTYTFFYQNRLDAKAIPGTGLDVDTFQLTGTGVANGLSTFFRAKVRVDSGANPTGFEIIEQSGDPFTCDPL
jgi:hypothetical protein